MRVEQRQVKDQPLTVIVEYPEYDKSVDNLINKIKNMSIVRAMLVPFIHVGKPLVVGSSGWWIYQFTAEGICRIAVPFFCICSGFFLARHFSDKGWYYSQVGKRVRTLIVPYLIWSVIFYLFVYSLFLISKPKTK